MIETGKKPHVICELEAPKVMMVDSVCCTFNISAFAFASVLKLTWEPDSNKTRSCFFSPASLWVGIIAIRSRAPAFGDPDPQCPVKTDVSACWPAELAIVVLTEVDNLAAGLLELSCHVVTDFGSCFFYQGTSISLPNFDRMFELSLLPSLCIEVVGEAENQYSTPMVQWLTQSFKCPQVLTVVFVKFLYDRSRFYFHGWLRSYGL